MESDRLFGTESSAARIAGNPCVTADREACWETMQCRRGHSRASPAAPQLRQSVDPCRTEVSLVADTR